jgi:hypothetical protein
VSDFIADKFKIDVFIDFAQQVVGRNEIFEDHHFQSVLAGRRIFEHGNL